MVAIGGSDQTMCLPLSSDSTHKWSLAACNRLVDMEQASDKTRTSANKRQPCANTTESHSASSMRWDAELTFLTFFPKPIIVIFWCFFISLLKVLTVVHGMTLTNKKWKVDRWKNSKNMQLCRLCACAKEKITTPQTHSFFVDALDVSHFNCNAITCNFNGRLVGWSWW